MAVHHWEAADPFLFVAYHDDAFPAGADGLAPAPASLAGRQLGSDFSGKDGWSMYHGQRVPGFPAHPHRGFETVSLVRRGFVDHSDSLGAQARFGEGDVQWVTAGAGVVHAEMFPLLRPDAPNPMEMFQIWLNLPPADKMAAPHFTMLWNEAIPRLRKDGAEVTVVAGALGGLTPPAPPPHSWASRPDSHVALWTVRLEPGARWEAPAGDASAVRTFYAFDGAGLEIGGQPVAEGDSRRLRADAAVTLAAGPRPVQALMLQGRPIGAPVAQYGPFVMNRPDEIQRAFMDYQRTRFGGWPWSDEAPDHGAREGRFAKHADGRLERP